MKLRASTWAALLYLIPGLGGFGIWLVLVSVGTPSLSSAIEVLTYMLNEAPNQGFFRWLLALPIASLVLSLAYISPAGRRRAGLVALICVGAVHAVASWRQLQVYFAVSSTVALIYGMLALKSCLQAISEAPNNSPERSRG